MPIRLLIALALATLTALPAQAETRWPGTEGVWGASLAKGYSRGAMQIVNTGDALYFESGAGAGSCRAALVPSDADPYAVALVKTDRNARPCKKFETFTLVKVLDDAIIIGTLHTKKMKRYTLPRQSTARPAMTLPSPAPAIRGVSLDQTFGEVKDNIAGLDGLTLGATRPWDRAGLVNPVLYAVSGNDKFGEHLYVVFESHAKDAPKDTTRPILVIRDWNPKQSERPTADAMRAALVEKYGAPSVEKRTKKFVALEWHTDAAGAPLSGKAALACSSQNQKKSQFTFTRKVPLWGRKAKSLGVSPACGISNSVDYRIVDAGKASKFFQVLYRHDALTSDHFARAMATARTTHERDRAAESAAKAVEPKL